jgi:regulator of sirC expression with transglutaminase-like and TPR domain
VHFATAYVALARGEWQAAVRAADAALALRPRYPEARLVRADALARLGREDEVRRELDRFLAEAPATMAAERARAQRRLSARTSVLEIK